MIQESRKHLYCYKHKITTINLLFNFINFIILLKLLIFKDQRKLTHLKLSIQLTPAKLNIHTIMKTHIIILNASKRHLQLRSLDWKIKKKPRQQNHRLLLVILEF